MDMTSGLGGGEGEEGKEEEKARKKRGRKEEKGLNVRERERVEREREREQCTEMERPNEGRDTVVRERTQSLEFYSFFPPPSLRPYFFSSDPLTLRTGKCGLIHWHIGMRAGGGE